MYKLTVILGALIAAGIISVSAIIAQSTTAQSESSAASAIMGGTFASVKTEITDEQIIITIDRNPNAPPVEPGTNVTVPEGPIIIIPPNNETGQNGTVIIPPVIEPPANVTLPGNVTLPVEPPVIIVDPEGNSTTVTPPSNVTVIDNGTVIVAPPDQPVTETPGNVTVIDPPAAPDVNATEPAPPCACPPAGVEGGAPDIQAPGSNITMQNETTIIRPDTEPGSESGGDNGGNGNGDSNNGG